MNNFNSFNCAPHGVRNVVMQGENGRVGLLTVPDAMLAPNTPKRYSFLALSDAHLNWGATNGTEDADNDFIRAMQYANDSDVAFTCICGDVIDGGVKSAPTNDDEAGLFARYARLRDRHAQKPVRVITGNHECGSGYDEVSDVTVALLETYYGDPLCYTFRHGDDVFIMVGEYGWRENKPFADGELEWLQARLEEHRNKRCFVFFHVFNFDTTDSGLPTSNFYDYDILANDAEQKAKFFSLLRHYKNTVWFHGHSHARFELQAVNLNANYSDAHGYRSIHIPSLSKPKNIVNGKVVTELEGSQGYVVDVHDNCIVLRGRDFVKGEFLPIATYKIDTTLVEIEKNTYKEE